MTPTVVWSGTRAIPSTHIRVIPYYRLYEAPPNSGSGHVSPVIGSRNGKTAGRLRLVNAIEDRPLPPFCLEMSGIHLASPIFLARICAATFISPLPPLPDPFFDLFVHDPRLIVRSFIYPSTYPLVSRYFVESTNLLSYIRSSGCAHCPIIFLRQSPSRLSRFHTWNLFLFFSSSRRLTFIAESTNTASWLRNENAPLRYYILTRE